MVVISGGLGAATAADDSDHEDGGTDDNPARAAGPRHDGAADGGVAEVDKGPVEAVHSGDAVAAASGPGRGCLAVDEEGDKGALVSSTAANAAAAVDRVAARGALSHRCWPRYSAGPKGEAGAERVLQAMKGVIQAAAPACCSWSPPGAGAPASPDSSPGDVAVIRRHRSDSANGVTAAAEAASVAWP